MDVRLKDNELGIGGKGSSMGWLRRGGYRCPLFDTIDAGCWADLIGSEHERHLRTIRYGNDQLAFLLACHELRGAIQTAPFPPVVRQWLDSDPIDRLGGTVAVRSSALSEDGVRASSAGQYESVLGVGDRAALEDAVREVLASFYGERAVMYRRAHGIADPVPLAMGLVIQRLALAEVSGIAFSVDPVSGTSDVVIEAAWGLGPPIVAGETEPDRFRVGVSGETRATVGRKQAALLCDPGTGELRSERTTSPDTELCMSLEQAAVIAKAVRKMARALRAPVDVEWTIAADCPEPVFLQVRPVTGSGSATGTSNDLIATY